MTTDEFRRIALGFPGTVESSHHQPVKGAWGRRGATSVNLFAVTEPLARRRAS